MTITVLDGGMGAELLRRRGRRTPLWSAQALIEDPGVVLETHLDYIAAGARLIITNSYSTVPSYLATAGLESRYVELTALAGALARRAATESSLGKESSPQSTMVIAKMIVPASTRKVFTRRTTAVKTFRSPGTR